MSRIRRTDPGRQWDLHCRYPDPWSFGSVYIGSELATWTLDLSVTPEEMRQIVASGRWFDSFRQDFSSDLRINGAEVSEFEAARIRMGEDPLAVLLKLGYRLVVVPWQPEKPS